MNHKNQQWSKVKLKLKQSGRPDMYVAVVLARVQVYIYSNRRRRRTMCLVSCVSHHEIHFLTRSLTSQPIHGQRVTTELSLFFLSLSPSYVWLSIFLFVGWLAGWLVGGGEWMNETRNERNLIHFSTRFHLLKSESFLATFLCAKADWYRTARTRVKLESCKTSSVWSHFRPFS